MKKGKARINKGGLSKRANTAIMAIMIELSLYLIGVRRFIKMTIHIQRNHPPHLPRGHTPVENKPCPECSMPRENDCVSVNLNAHMTHKMDISSKIIESFLFLTFMYKLVNL
jgi:hypothetical protein